MNDNSTAEQNLGAIRGLIERGQIYRAVSARTALIGGVLSILTAGAIYLNDEVTRILDRPVRPRELELALAEFCGARHATVAAWSIQGG